MSRLRPVVAGYVSLDDESGIQPVIADALWVDVPAGSTKNPGDGEEFLSCDTSGAQTTINLRAAAAANDGEIQLIKCSGNMLSPVIVNAGAGTTVELLNAPGTYGASTWMPIQGQSVFFKYDKSTTQWKVWSSSEGSGAVGTSAFNPGWYAETTIFVDPQNTSTTALDSNDGTTNATALRTWAEAIRRWGDISPSFTVSCTITFLSSQTAGQDNIFFEPQCDNGIQVNLVGTLVSAGADFAAGVLGGGYGSAGAAPSAGGTEMTMATVPVYIVANVLLQNTTRNGYAYVDSVAANTAKLTQPLTAASITNTNLPSATSQNNWVANDNIKAWIVPSLNIKRWTPKGGDLTAGFAPSGSTITFVKVVDTSAAHVSVLGLESRTANLAMNACIVDSQINMSGQGGFVSVLVGTIVRGVCVVQSQGGNVLGGALAGGSIFAGNASVVHGNNVVLHSNITISGMNLFGQFFSDGNITIQGGLLEVFNFAWGSYNVVVEPNSAWFNSTGSTFVLKALLTNGTLKLGTATTGSKYQGAGVNVDGVALTPANIDAGGTGGPGLFNPVTGARFCDAA